MKILNFGSLNIDYVYKVDHFVQKGETILSHSLQVFSGGKGTNQSIAMGRAGLAPYHGGNIGEDGLFLTQLLRDSGVDTHLVQVRTDVRTGNAIIQNDSQGDNCIILYGGANQAVTREQADRILDEFEAGDYLLLQNEINELPYIVEKAWKKGMVILLNPSPMNEQIDQIPKEAIGWLLLNEVEASQITGENPGEEETLLNGLEKLYPNAGIVLTLGEKGSVCRWQGQQVRQSIYKVETVDTTAAGDTFTGYFIAGIVQGQSLESSLDMAAKASALAVSKMGAAPSIPWLAEVKQTEIGK